MVAIIAWPDLFAKASKMVFHRLVHMWRSRLDLIGHKAHNEGATISPTGMVAMKTRGVRLAHNLTRKTKTPIAWRLVQGIYFPDLLSLYGGSEEIAIDMQQIGSVFEGRPRTTEQLTTGISKANTTDNCTTEAVVTKLDNKSVDEALAKTADLISPTFKSWYALKVRELGYWRYIGLAHEARRGRQPKKLFSHLLKTAGTMA